MGDTLLKQYSKITGGEEEIYFIEYVAAAAVKVASVVSDSERPHRRQPTRLQTCLKIIFMKISWLKCSMGDLKHPEIIFHS